MISGQAGKNNTKSERRINKLFLGVDGGGTKTHAVLLDGADKIIAEGFSGASNPMRVGIEPAAKEIFEAVNNAFEQTNRNQYDIAAAVFGLAGVRRNDIRLRIRERLWQNLRTKIIEVVTDAEIALYGATKNSAGLVIIAGTGSICLGRNEKGETALAGGWGPLAGDEGSGAGIARRALQAIAKSLDGRGEPTNLSEKAVKYFRTARAEDLIVAIYAPQVDNRKIAGFARFVIESAKEGDAAAQQIVREAGYELGTAANAVIRRLELEQKKIPIAKVGGIFQAGELLTKTLAETIQKVAPKTYFIELPVPSAVAAAQMARQIYEVEHFEDFRS